jgi:Rrf2 family protein
MFRLSKKIDYALLALQYLASPGEPGDVSARATAERFEIPAALLAKILQRLAHDGLITAHRGVHGGYRLARSPDAISIADIAQAVDAVDGRASLAASRPVDGLRDQLATRVRALLRVLTVADIGAALGGSR